MNCEAMASQLLTTASTPTKAEFEKLKIVPWYEIEIRLPGP